MTRHSRIRDGSYEGVEHLQGVGKGSAGKAPGGMGRGNDDKELIDFVLVPALFQSMPPLPCQCHPSSFLWLLAPSRPRVASWRRRKARCWRSPVAWRRSCPYLVPHLAPHLAPHLVPGGSRRLRPRGQTSIHPHLYLQRMATLSSGSSAGRCWPG